MAFDFSLLGVAVIFVGIAILFAAMLLSSSGREKGERSEARGGGVIMIGPIPIIFGTDTKWVIVAIVLAGLLLLLGLFVYWR